MSLLADRIIADPIFLAMLAIAGYVYALALYARGIGPTLRSTTSPGLTGEAGTDPDDLFFVLVLPCLNERPVIARTIAGLLELDGRYLVLVVDDASDDGSIEVIAPFVADPRVILVPRTLPDARVGKGAVLNAAVREVIDMGLADRHGAERVVITVFDADGRVEADFLSRVGPFFADPLVAGVQTPVRMTNRHAGVLAFWQHLEFVVWGEIFARAKDRLGTATLGGNGQCVRLSALLALGGEPWRSSLTEDLDLSIRLILHGWRIRFCPDTEVWQQAVPELGRLVRQRARWAQGHVASWQFLPFLVHSGLPWVARIDLVVFLLLPAFFLPIGIGSGLAALGMLEHFGRWTLSDLVAWYVLGFVTAPLVIATIRRAEGGSLARAIVNAHLFVLYSFVWGAAFAIAAWHVIRGRRSWAKTSRAHDQVPRPVPADG